MQPTAQRGDQVAQDLLAVSTVESQVQAWKAPGEDDSADSRKIKPPAPPDSDTEFATSLFRASRPPLEPHRQ